MRRTAVIGLLVAALLALFVPFAPQAAAADADAEAHVLSLINDERVSRGQNALGLRDDVVPVARTWTARMIADQVLSHNPALAAQMPADWVAIGENVGAGSTVEGLHTAFMNSAGHRANVLGDFHYAGVGVDRDSKGRIWVTVNFMKSRNGQVAISSGGQVSGSGGVGSGYWMVGRDGSVYAFGGAGHLGNAPTASAEDLEPTPSKAGYWVVSSSGHVFAFGNAPHLGGIDGAVGAGERVTSISATPSGGGYWLFTTAGRVVSFGDAPHLGDMAGTRLNGPVLDSIPTPSGRGYYMVASDGGIFTFGDADFRGSMGGSRLNAPVQSLVPDSDGAGYWLVASDGGIFAFDSAFHGSMGATRLNRPITGMVAFGPGGYLMVGEDGGIFTFGSAAFHGSLGDRPPASPITSVAVRL
ncbi:MAG TPA: CAP domain-containing protein [Acidimicrobiales bacterium]|nr:CAP domain-containing protein [Acidimicrobiales bacterium]